MEHDGSSGSSICGAGWEDKFEGALCHDRRQVIFDHRVLELGDLSIGLRKFTVSGELISCQSRTKCSEYLPEDLGPFETATTTSIATTASITAESAAAASTSSSTTSAVVSTATPTSTSEVTAIASTPTTSEISTSASTTTTSTVRHVASDFGEVGMERMLVSK
jgi:hypothetical protein